MELMFEWNHYFDVRRWKVADMAVGDGWVYPTYHKGGEGGEVHGMNYRSDAPAFFEKVVFDTRKFEKKNYLFAIPQEDILRVEKLVQNPDGELNNHVYIYVEMYMYGCGTLGLYRVLQAKSRITFCFYR